MPQSDQQPPRTPGANPRPQSPARGQRQLRHGRAPRWWRPKCCTGTRTQAMKGRTPAATGLRAPAGKNIFIIAPPTATAATALPTVELWPRGRQCLSGPLHHLYAVSGLSCAVWLSGGPGLRVFSHRRGCTGSPERSAPPGRRPRIQSLALATGQLGGFVPYHRLAGGGFD